MVDSANGPVQPCVNPAGLISFLLRVGVDVLQEGCTKLRSVLRGDRGSLRLVLRYYSWRDIDSMRYGLAKDLCDAGAGIPFLT